MERRVTKVPLAEIKIALLMGMMFGSKLRVCGLNPRVGRKCVDASCLSKPGMPQRTNMW